MEPIEVIDLTDDFQKDDRVFAKMIGYPAWPARIMGPSAASKGYVVKFFGTYDTATINLAHIFEYNDENLLKYGKPKFISRWKEAMEEIKNNVDVDDGRAPISIITKRMFLPSSKKKAKSKKNRPSTSTSKPFTSNASSSPSISKAVKKLSVSSRSGRQIKPKRFEDGFVYSAVQNQATLLSLYSSFNGGDNLDSCNHFEALPFPVATKPEGKAPILEEPPSSSRQLVLDTSAQESFKLVQGKGTELESEHQGQVASVLISVSTNVTENEGAIISNMKTDYSADNINVEANNVAGNMHVEADKCSDVRTLEADYSADNINEDENEVSSSVVGPVEEMREEEKTSMIDSLAKHDNLEEPNEGRIMIKITFQDKSGNSFEYLIPKKTSFNSEAEREEYYEKLISIFQIIGSVEGTDSKGAIRQFMEQNGVENF